MKKTDLIFELSQRSALSKTCVNTILAALTDGIASGEGVEVRGFGSFHRKHKSARLGINPKTGERTEVEAKFMPFFKPGKSLKEVVNN